MKKILLLLAFFPLFVFGQNYRSDNSWTITTGKIDSTFAQGTPTEIFGYKSSWEFLSDTSLTDSIKIVFGTGLVLKNSSTQLYDFFPIPCNSCSDQITSDTALVYLHPTDYVITNGDTAIGILINFNYGWPGPHYQWRLTTYSDTTFPLRLIRYSYK